MTPASETEPCRRLFASVLAQCTEDAVRDQARHLTGNPKFAPMLKSRQNAVPRSWISSGGFLEVCALAGQDGSELQRRLIAKIQTIEGCEEILNAISNKTARYGTRSRVDASRDPMHHM